MSKRMMGWGAAAFVFLAPLPGHAANGIVDEVQGELLAHDVPIGGDRHETGVDVNGEVLFVSPSIFQAIWAPRPHLGISINSAGGNSYAYTGLTWTARFYDLYYANLGLGGAIHDGPDSSVSRTHFGLGTRVLFHESAELGYHWTPAWSTGIYFDHISNANLGGHNPGISNLGFRVGYSF